MGKNENMRSDPPEVSERNKKQISGYHYHTKANIKVFNQ